MEKTLSLFSGIILILLWWTVFPVPTRAESIKVTVSADEVHYNYESKQVEALGNVLITYKTTKVESDEAIIDQDQNILLATGNVRVNKDGDEVTGDKFLYYLKTQQGWIASAEMDLNDEQTEGTIKLSAAEAFVKGEEIRSKKSFFTSCDLDQSHYHFTAADIEYYPENRIVLHHVWYWEGRFRIFYLPYLFVSLKKDENNFEVRVGQNEAVGWFLYVGYNYYLSDDSYGKIKLDLTERGGDGIGVKHYIENSPTSRWYQEYGINDPEDPNFPENDYMFGFGYENKTDPKRIINTTFQNWRHFTELRECNLDTKYFFSLAGQSPYPSLLFNFSENELLATQIMDLSGNWSYRPDPTWNINLTGRWYNSETPDLINSSFRYDFFTVKDWKWSNLSLKFNDTKVYTGAVSSINLKPDLTYTIPKWSSPGIGDLKLISEYLYIEKFPDNSLGERWALDIQKLPVKLWQQDSLTLNYQSQFRYRDFWVWLGINDLREEETETESDLYALTTDLGLINQFTKEFSTEVRAGFTEFEGIPNNYFRGDDYVQKGAFITNGWYWKSMILNASLNTGYHFYTDYADPLNFWLRWTPVPRQELTFRSIYNWGVGLGQTDLQINYSPKDNWRLMLLLGYNFSDPVTPWTNKEFEAMISQKLNDKWRMELASRFDFFTNGFSVAQLGVAYDWHCRELMVNYDWIKREYWLQVLIKAFPDTPLRLNSNLENVFNELGFY